MDSVSRRTVIVTGGSRGIGRAVVAAFSAEGARVYFTYRHQKEAADAVVNETGAEAIRCDQCVEEEITDAVAAIVDREGSIDVLVNSAGMVADQFLMMMPSDTWIKVMDTNINGLFRWTKAVSRPMLSTKSGAIVNIASVSGLVGIAGQANYAASKGAIIAFSRSCAAEFGPKGIRVNTVVPGFIKTDMTARMPRAIKRQNIERILVKRFGNADEVANVVTFLASNRASYIVGQTIVVDGGLTGTVA